MKFHLSLPVSDIKKTKEFYSTLFESAPTKEKNDYLKFEPEHLALNISFHLGTPTPHLHLGLQIPASNELEQHYQRLLPLLHQERKQSVCCYAEQDKFWIRDTDGYSWELYQLVFDTAQKMDTDLCCCATDPEASPSPNGCC